MTLTLDIIVTLALAVLTFVATLCARALRDINTRLDKVNEKISSLRKESLSMVQKNNDSINLLSKEIAKTQSHQETTEARIENIRERLDTLFSFMKETFKLTPKI